MMKRKAKELQQAKREVVKVGVALEEEDMEAFGL